MHLFGYLICFDINFKKKVKEILERENLKLSYISLVPPQIKSWAYSNSMLNWAQTEPSLCILDLKVDIWFLN